jgi:YVTN family beta-propeller protein
VRDAAARGDRAFTGNIPDHTISVIDLSGRDSTRVFPVGQQPEGIAVTPNGRWVWIGSNRDSTVMVPDARTGVAERKARFTIRIPADSLVATAEVPGSPSPEGVALSRDSRWTFVTLQGRNRGSTIDLASGASVRYAPTGV